MKIFVAAPAHDGRLCVQTAQSLIDEQVVCLAAGHEMSASFLPGCSLLPHARNQLCADFFASDCDKLVFVDADVGWKPGSLLRLASHAVDIVGGAYRYKSEEEGYPVTWIEERTELRADPTTGLLEVRCLPGGFISISRAALERLREAFPERRYSYWDHDYHGFFHTPIADGKMYGEDAAFCCDWRAVGGAVWLDPEIALTHTGAATFSGHIGNWLRTDERTVGLRAERRKRDLRRRVAARMDGHACGALDRGGA